jgi:predicted transcriptional regulator
MTPRESIAFLVGSESRVTILRNLCEQSWRPTELAEASSCARETAQRTLTSFSDRGWVKKNGGGKYELTPAGRMVASEYEQFEQTVEAADRLSVLLANVGDAVADLDADVLSRLNAATATTENPHAPINRFLSVVGDDPVDEFQGITPIVSRVFNQAAERIIGPKSEVELVIDEDVLETSATEYPDALERAFELDQFTLYLSPTELTFGLMIVDGSVYLGAYDDNGNLVASVDGDDEEFVTWARNVYERHRGAASRPAFNSAATSKREADAE